MVVCCVLLAVKVQDFIVSMHKSGENIEMLSFCILNGNEKK